MKKKLLLFGLCILLSLLVTACNRETTFIPLIIQNNGSATGDCTCTFSREYNTTFELSNLFYPINSNPYNYRNDTGSSGGWTNTSTTTSTNLNVNTSGNLNLGSSITMNGSSGSNASIIAEINGDGEKSIITRSSQSIDRFLGYNGYDNIRNSSGSWVMYTRSDGSIVTRTTGSSSDWYNAYKKMSNQYLNTTSDVTFDVVNATRYDKQETYQNFYGSRIIEDDFCYVTSFLSGSAMSGGTAGTGTGYITHPCMRYYSSGLNSNSGYYYSIGNTNLLLAGSESTDFIFYKNSRSGVNSSYVRLGFFDSAGSTTEPTDGVWISINNLTLTGRVRSNSAEINTSSTYTINENQWYRIHIDVINTTKADFYLYNSTLSAGTGNTVLLWNDDVTGTLPTGTGRQTGFGAQAYVSGNSTSTNILLLDYVNLMIDRTLVR